MLLVSFGNHLIGGALVIGLIGLFILFYLLNKKTPKPEGCESEDEKCEGCTVLSCSNRKEKKEEE